MISKYTVANFLLLIVVVLLGFKNYGAWTHPVEAVPKNETYKGSGQKSGTPPVTPDAQGVKDSIVSFKTIPEKNIFSPERKDFPIAPAPTVNPNVRPKARPQVSLYGVAIAEDYQAATITSPGRPLQKGERESMTLKIGEKVGEYRLAKVLPDRITMENGNDSFEVFLYDPNMPKRRADSKTETKPQENATPRAASSPSPGASPAPDPSAVSPSPGVPPRVPQRGLAAGPAAPLPSEASLEKPVAAAQQQLGAPSPSSWPSQIPPSPSPTRFQPRPAYPAARQSRATLSGKTPD